MLRCKMTPQRRVPDGRHGRQQQSNAVGCLARSLSLSLSLPPSLSPLSLSVRRLQCHLRHRLPTGFFLAAPNLLILWPCPTFLASPQELMTVSLGTTDNLTCPTGVSNFPSLCLFLNFHILGINPFPMHNKTASRANRPTVKVCEAN